MPFKLQFQQQMSSKACNRSYTASQDKHRRSLHKLHHHLSHSLHPLTRKRQKHNSPYNRQWRRRKEVKVQLYSFFDYGAGWWWVLTPRPDRFPPGKDPVPIVQEAGWASKPVWKATGSLAPRRGSNSGPSMFIWNVPVFVTKNYLTDTTRGGKHLARLFVYPSLATLPQNACSDPLPLVECARQSLPCWLQPWPLNRLLYTPPSTVTSHSHPQPQELNTAWRQNVPQLQTLGLSCKTLIHPLLKENIV